eukprot:5012368-Amphidinium_carterae.1
MASLPSLRCVGLALSFRGNFQERKNPAESVRLCILLGKKGNLSGSSRLLNEVNSFLQGYDRRPVSQPWRSGAVKGLGQMLSKGSKSRGTFDLPVLHS